MFAPMMWYRRLKPISIYFPKRLLLSFLVVFAFPIALGNKANGLFKEVMQKGQCCFIANVMKEIHKGEELNHPSHNNSQKTTERVIIQCALYINLLECCCTAYTMTAAVVRTIAK